MNDGGVVSADSVAAWVEAARGLLRVARAGSQYPDARRVDTMLEALQRRGTPFQVDPRSGLPTLAELAAVRADRQVAPEFLAQHASRLADRAAYFRWLSTTELPAASATDARLVARLAGSRARLRIVHDTLDPENGCWVRLAAIVEQYGEALVRFERQDLCVPKEALSDALERCAGADAELAFLLLAALPGVTVGEVVRGQIGPLESARLALPRPSAPPLPQSIVGSPVPSLLHLVVERAAADVAQDLCRDPFSRLYRESLAPGPRAAAEARRAELGYRISKERRLICAPANEAAVRAWARSTGVPLVIRSR